jgi:hypothetical protein
MAVRSLPVRHSGRNYRGLWNRLVGHARQIVSHASPVLRNLFSMPLSVLGYAAIDIGVFRASSIAGWIVTGLSLIWLEYLIADEES